MKNYTMQVTKPMSDWKTQTVEVPERDISFPGKYFLKDRLDLTSCEVSLNALLPGQGTPFCHAHKQNEEIYIFLQGNGEFQVDDEIIPVSSGSVIKVNPSGERAWRNTGGEELQFIVIQAKADSLEGYTLEDGVIVERDPFGTPE